MLSKIEIADKWQGVSDKFSTLAMREKVLIAASILLVFYLIWDFAVASSLSAQRKQLMVRYDVANRELKNLTVQEQVMVKALTHDPNTEKRRKIIELEKRLLEENTVLQQMSVGLISAQSLPEVLRDVLGESSKLRLVGMQSLAPTKLELSSDDLGEDEFSGQAEQGEGKGRVRGKSIDQKRAAIIDDARIAEERIIGVYKHSVRITLKGQYFFVVDYLKRLESLSWRFYWEFIDYEVEVYPTATVTLEVYTLSTDKGAWGV